MENKSKDNSGGIKVSFMVFFCLVILLGIFLFFLGAKTGQEGTIQYLCRKQTYDFCEEVETVYKLKVNKEATTVFKLKEN